MHFDWPSALSVKKAERFDDFETSHFLTADSPDSVCTADDWLENSGQHDLSSAEQHSCCSDDSAWTGSVYRDLHDRLSTGKQI